MQKSCFEVNGGKTLHCDKPPPEDELLDELLTTETVVTTNYHLEHKKFHVMKNKNIDVIKRKKSKRKFHNV